MFSKHWNIGFFVYITSGTYVCVRLFMCVVKELALKGLIFYGGRLKSSVITPIHVNNQAAKPTRLKCKPKHCIRFYKRVRERERVCVYIHSWWWSLKFIFIHNNFIILMVCLCSSSALCVYIVDLCLHRRLRCPSIRRRRLFRQHT